MAVRIGAVSYLNSKPLVHFLPEQLPADCDLYVDLPSRLADQLNQGSVDIALIPSIEYFSNGQYRIYSDACIACHGAVWSVKIFFRREPEKVRTIALDEGSRTSVALAKILFSERFGKIPECTHLPIGSDVEDTQADAVLLIGDRAMHSPHESFVDCWDLGEEWKRVTGLPFVFAMWVGLYNQRASEIERWLAAARDRGVASARELALQYAPAYDLTTDDCYRYFAQHLYFSLGENEMKGLSLFYQKACRLGLTPGGDAVPSFATTRS